jgi:ATP-binding cassette subfamily B protein
MMLYLSPLLTLANLAVIPVMLLIVGKVASMSRNFFMQQQTALGELNGFIEETISGQKVVKVFTKEQTMLERFSTLNNNYRRSGIKAQILSGFIPPFMNILNNLNFAVIASLGGWLIVRGLSTIGVIGGFLNYSRQFTGPVMQLSNLFNMIQAAIAGAERVFEVLDQEPEPEDAPDAKAPDRIDGEVQFEDVSFAYEKERPVLHGISLEAKPGQVIALVGPTGAGKTTIINLLTRFYDIDQGRITIDGLDIRQIKRDRLRSLLGVVLQDTYLFSASVKENIRYGRLDATDAEVEQAAKLANAHSFIIRLPNGYDTILSEDGSNLSQGQRQLLAIARAILADPAILILDEATSSVDTRTEQQIQSAMLELMKGRTSFVIAHRLSTIRNADLIVVIDQGRIVEQGKHQELLERKGFYYNLYMSQFSLPLSS